MDNQLNSSKLKELRQTGRELIEMASVGKAGLSDALVQQVATLLELHELVKVRVAADNKEGRLQAAAELAEKTHSTLVELRGRMALLYKLQSTKDK